MTKLRANTALAAEIAGIDRQRFNEAVAADFYPCAPKTVAGRARSFGVNDIVALKVYGYLLAEGVIPRHAGNIACGLLDLLAVYPDASAAVYIVTQMGRPCWLLPSALSEGATHCSGSPLVSVRHWYLGPIRKNIIDLLEYEDEHRVLGPSEEDI